MRLREVPKKHGVYLLHFKHGLDTRKGIQAQHYNGCAKDLRKRITEHMKGISGVRIIEAVHKRGIKIRTAKIWVTNTHKEAYELEVSLKKRKNGRLLCPICTPRKGDKQT